MGSWWWSKLINCILFALLVASCKEVEETKCVQQQYPYLTTIPTQHAFNDFLATPDTFSRHLGVVAQDPILFTDNRFWEFIIEKKVLVLSVDTDIFYSPKSVIPPIESLHLSASVRVNDCNLKCFPHLNDFSSSSKNTFIFPDSIEHLVILLEDPILPDYIFQNKNLSILSIVDIAPMQQIDTITVRKLKMLDSLHTLNITGTLLARNALHGNKKAMENIKFLESELPNAYVWYQVGSK